MSNITTIGTVLRGRHKSNPDARAKVWATHPTNPRRICLWMKSGKFSWNNASSLETNYEPAPADEPTWPDPVRPCPADYTDRTREVTPLERVAAAEVVSPPVPVAVEPDIVSPEAPPPPPPANDDAANETVIVLRGRSAVAFARKVSMLNSVARLTGGQPMSAAELVSVAVDNFVSSLIGGAA